MNVQMLDDQVDFQVASRVENLLSELYHYRHQSEKLQKINTLYQRMAGILDLPSMIEAYSIWLMEFVDHELIGYHNPARQRMHMFCSHHGPKRREAIQLAQEILEQPMNLTPDATQAAGFKIHKWTFNAADCEGMLVILTKGKALVEDELQFIDESLVILAEPLKRALEYEEIFAQAHRDSLTGLPNRFVFKERIGSIIEQARRHCRPLTLAALDLDRFKAVNDTMGHFMGDQVLRQVAEALQREIRLSDLLVRMGGDEFLLVLPDTSLQDAKFLAERLCLAVERLDLTTKAGKLAVSIGLIEWRPDLSIQSWLEQADDILYQAKANGGAQVAVS
ncbi:MAG: GGDEF domain-containing protein [Desulfobulbus sp.]|uniref:GGDEF domain-containing protein n=1 Tax=Desulfobulbus sp. TaxID=895 RepID=UPI002840E37D|nr:GGDEF domain-containing protein [Desulfobulbus sp.]MDR2549376.1 GGDEF domain-containing protein [Desulfobulbus sp.]